MRISKQPGKVVKLFIDGYQIEQEADLGCNNLAC